MSVSRRLGLAGSSGVSSSPASSDPQNSPGPHGLSQHFQQLQFLHSPKTSPAHRAPVASPAPPPGENPLAAYSQLTALENLHRFVLTGTLQQSLFGIVKLAFDRTLRIQVAIKISRRERAASQQTRSGVSVLENVRRESAVCRHLFSNDLMSSDSLTTMGMSGRCKKSSRVPATEEENSTDPAMSGEPGASAICRFVEEFEDESFHYFISEFLPAGDLYSTLTSTAQHRIAEGQAKILFRQLVLGVDFLHRHQVAHLDLSLENVCLDGADNCKIIDFGVAAIHPLTPSGVAENYFLYTPSVQLRNEKTGKSRSFPCQPITKISEKPGKIRYMSPELFSGAPWDAFANDVFSLGVILYSLLTGRPPFQQADTSDVWFSVIYSGQWLTPAIRNQSSAHVYTHLSSPALDLLNSILKPEDVRLSLEEILAHPWLEG